MPELVDIFIIDDNSSDLKIAEDTLKEKYRIVTAQSGEEAFGLLARYTPKLILLNLDLRNTEGGGRAVMKRFREDEVWKEISVIFLIENADFKTENVCFELGAVDFFAKPYVPEKVRSRVERIIELYDMKENLALRLEETNQKAAMVSLNSIMAIANTIDAKDAYTSGHSVRVAKCAEAIARRLGWDEDEVRNLHYVALLHDIGKIGVPDSILNKPARLNDEEFALIKRHPVIGNEILKNVHVIRDVAAGALYHHERYDGRGYPFGLKGEEIPLCARIIEIADTYDAMTSNRIYRAKLPTDKVIAEFEKYAGTQFDPELAKLFVEMLKEGFHIEEENRREGDSAWESHDTQSGVMLNRVLTEYTSGAQKKGMVDSLTGLYSRSYGERKIEELLENADRGALMMIDLDNFKNINEKFGHIVGDKILKILADTLTSLKGGRDIVCRLGGDEFLMYLSDMPNRQEVRAKAETVMTLFSSNLVQADCGKITAVSVGIAVTPHDGRTFSLLYNNADKALYHVKKSGKNDCAFYSEEKEKAITDTLPDTDLDHIRYMIEGRMDTSKGALKVEYEEFKKLYSYISRCVKRKGQMVQTLLFTIGNEGRDYLDNSVYEEAMAALEVAVAYSLRMVDVGSRYSSVQYIVILVDTNLENGRKVAQRVISQFYKIYSGSGIVLSYDIQTMMTGAWEEDREYFPIHEND